MLRRDPTRVFRRDIAVRGAEWAVQSAPRYGYKDCGAKEPAQVFFRRKAHRESVFPLGVCALEPSPRASSSPSLARGASRSSSKLMESARRAGHSSPCETRGGAAAQRRRRRTKRMLQPAAVGWQIRAPTFCARTSALPQTRHCARPGRTALVHRELWRNGLGERMGIRQGLGWSRVLHGGEALSRLPTLDERQDCLCETNDSTNAHLRWAKITRWECCFFNPVWPVLWSIAVVVSRFF